MTTPVAGDPGSQDQNQAIAEQLQAQATGVQGTDSAGIYGDPAGAAQHAPVQPQEQVAADLVAAGSKPAEVDTAALLEQLQALAAKVADLQSQGTVVSASASAKPPVLDEVINALSGVTPGIVHAFQLVAARIDALEGKPADAEA